MALFVLHKLILQTCMRSHPVQLDIWFLVRLFVYFHTLCVQTVKALVRLRGCAGSPEPSLVAYVISTIISWAGSYCFWYWHRLIADLYAEEIWMSWKGYVLLFTINISGTSISFFACLVSDIDWIWSYYLSTLTKLISRFCDITLSYW